MGALAVSVNWIPEDDRLLKNAVEAGASLESLAKGAVKFSRKFTLCELKERWHCLLYDLDTSTKAASKILEIEMEQAASDNLNSKKAFTCNANDNVQSHYYARQKIICVARQSFDSDKQLRNENMQAASFDEAPEAHLFLSEYDNQIDYDNGMSGNDGSLFGCINNNDMSCMSLDGIECDIGDPSVEENFQQSDFPHLLGEDLISVHNTLNGSDPRSPLTYEKGLSPSQSEMNIWNMYKGNDLDKINASITNNLHDYNNDVDRMSGDGFPDAQFMSDQDLMFLANTSMDDLLLIAGNGGGNKDELLNSDLLDAPSETHHELFVVIEPLAENLVYSYPDFSEADVQSFTEQMNFNLKSVFGIDIPSNNSSQITNSFMYCCMNKWAGDAVPIPDNTDNHMSLPKVSFSFNSSRHKRLKLENSLPSFSDKKDSNLENKENFMKNPVQAETSKVVSVPTQVDALEEENQENFDDICSYLEGVLQENSDNDLDSMDTCQEGAKSQNLLQQETANVDQGQGFSDSEDVPYTSDVENTILEMGLNHYDGESYSIAKEVSKYQQLDTKKMIRLEQNLVSHINRSIASNGAYAVLYGRKLKYFIKKPQVTIGRETKDNKVDIDLQREGHAHRVSRRQAIIKMDEEGVFHVQNLGKVSIFVNGKEVVSKRCSKLPSQALVRILGLRFTFDFCESAVRQYVIDNKADEEAKL